MPARERAPPREPTGAALAGPPGEGLGFDALAAKRPWPGTPARPPGTICVGYESRLSGTTAPWYD